MFAFQYPTSKKFGGFEKQFLCKNPRAYGVENIYFVNEYNLCLTPLKYRDGSPVTRNTWFIYCWSVCKPC